MTQNIRISHPETLLFADWTTQGKAVVESGNVHSFTSGETDRPGLMSFTGEFKNLASFNTIAIEMHPEFNDFFPETFRFEISSDGIVWEPMFHETNFKSGLALSGKWNFTLTSAKYIKFLFTVNKTNSNGKYFAAFGTFSVGISGIIQLKVSSELDRLWVKENLIDCRNDYGWSSSLRSARTEETVEFDLGSVNSVNEFRMLSKNDPDTFFPSGFRISYSDDNISWHHLFEENSFIAEPGTWYRWRFVPTNLRYLRLTIDDGAVSREGKYISQIIELELYASRDLNEKGGGGGHSEPIPYSSVLRSGIVRLARDGEEREGLSVQSNDRRLKDATEERKGIVELASDGEDTPGVVIQGHDRRLKMATEDLPGIIRLARDGETRPGHAVQGHDKRLKEATEESQGIVELAADGEARPGVAVQGHDKRLRSATTEYQGIVKLAESGSTRSSEVIQGSDSRLRKATTETDGISKFARHGSSNDLEAVQGSDPRLKEAGTEMYGIVILARDGETKKGRVIQSDDSRLNAASEKSPGIVELCAPGSELSGKAVQGNDPRLSDARKPLSHSHDYAKIDHEFSSHIGEIRIQRQLGKSYKGIAEPPSGYSPIEGINEGDGSGLLGRGSDGVVGTGRFAGVAGISAVGGNGVAGYSRNGRGGAFYSEKDFSLQAGGEDEARGIKSSPWSFKSIGQSVFQDTVYVASEKTDSDCLAKYFRVLRKDVISAGDLLCLSSQMDSLEKSLQFGSTSVIGVAVNHAGLILDAPFGISESGNPALPDDVRLVAIAGIVRVRASAQESDIKPGDLLVSSRKAGRVEKLKESDYKPGMIVGKSLDLLSEGEGEIRMLLTQM